ncbi:ZYRO0G12694p [Zygosaccharomyces rouxii]|uniref:ZYRO0G12694p n=1 Tax=Zygosaccharomyces rouxii (strain ATCC 2623 / CBS 732 / NBRC 1130 / NCYC 568 / NRRL Y-229) TaxID=559307 RepID=C5E0H3_ZYGRC|nr:uncharacterized protein ZYRO0G12694g [Zygosaccharomyces rouxii]KAH9202600.1 hypothetical protein LQ764DRAFT_207571 [Zygosaccharomyces rouxii]CAR29607.1 ZYRO0G12694p [Zygosaccharomyces rouxii]
MNLKSLLVSSLVAGAAIADSGNSTTNVPSSCTIKPNSTATQQSDLDKYSSCQTLVGNLTVSGSEIQTGSLNGVKNLEGSLTIYNASNLVQFNADTLQNISHSLNLQLSTSLQTASFNGLEEVDTIKMVALPQLHDFETNVKKANVVYISDTSLKTVHAFGELQKVRSFNLNNNKDLANLESSLESVEDELEFSANGQDANVTFNDLKWANNITLRDVHRASFVSLKQVNSSLGFINNTIDSLNLSNLTSVGGSLSFVSNRNLTGINATNLEEVGGGFVIANNSNFKLIGGFPKLSKVGGAISVVGNYTYLDLESLNSVKGDGDFETNSGNFSCSSLKSLQSKGGIKGDSFVCKNGAQSTSIKLSSESSSKSSSSGSSKTESSTKSSDASQSASGKSGSKSTASNDGNQSKGMAAAQFAPAGSLMGAMAAVAAALL